MERLSPHVILRHGLIAGRPVTTIWARDIGGYIARACFFTSDFAAAGFEHKMDGIALFTGNKPLVRITVDLIFADPYFRSARAIAIPPRNSIRSSRTFDPMGRSKSPRLVSGRKFLTEAPSAGSR